MNGIGTADMGRGGTMPSSENKNSARTQALARDTEPRGNTDLGPD